MFHRKSLTISLAALILCLSAFLAAPVFAQGGDDTAAQKQKVAELMEQNKYTEALPLLEKLVVAEPANGQMHFYLGFALIAQANTTKDQAERKALSLRARSAFVKAKNLQVDEPIVDALIASIPPDGSEAPSFSPNITANSLMVEAESFFSQGKMDEALANYKKALELDPKLYHAALFSGDVYMQKGNLTESTAWYERAIAIDPTKETAYRYSATPLMKQGKTQAARDRYVEAFITEPYSQFTRGGLVQWATVTKTSLAHPTIDIPSDIKFDDKGNANISLDAGALLGGKDDGSFAWISYGATRTQWHKEKFAKTFPKESVYRHSLPEEAEALRSVIAIATSDKKATLSPSLQKLKRLDDQGLLEAYILLGRADAGIAQDHPEYRKGNRDKLRRYMIEYVLTGGGPS
jgi:tetratricopeptide (TPR) repeat protein